MKLFSSKPSSAGRAEAVTRYRGAHRALLANDRAERAAGGKGGESPEFERLNAAADEAAKDPTLPRRLRHVGGRAAAGRQ